MKKIKSILIIGTVLVLCLLSYGKVSADQGGYRITDYKFEGTYNTDNTVSVKETIDVDFSQSRHGIYRILPLSMYVKRVTDNGDTKVLEYSNAVKDVSVEDWNYDTDSEDGTYQIKIGSSGSYVSGAQRYVIKYKYVMPDDRVKKEDMIFYSVLGAEWKTYIDHFYFDMKFAKELTEKEMENMKVFSGSYGGEGNNLNVDMAVTPNRITGSADNIGPEKAITIAGYVREGYFEGEKTYSSIFSLLFGILAAIAALVVIVFLLVRPKKKPVVTVEFYPPEGFSSAEVGMAIDEKADDEDMISLIPWWAQKGYLTIEEKPDKKGRGGKHASLVLHKIKDLPSTAPQYQRSLFSAIFGSGDSKDLKKLPTSFADKFNTAKSMLQGSFNGKKQLTKGEGGAFVTALVVNFAFFFAAMFSSPVSYLDNLIGAIIAAVPMLVIGFIRMFSVTKDTNRSASGWFKYILIISVLAIASLVGTALCLVDNYFKPQHALVVWGIVLIVNLLNGRWVNYTDYGLEIVGKLQGLKQFIKTAELDKLKMLVEDNPEYFYDILPYAMVFGLTKHWSEQFKSLTIKAPKWYYGYDDSMFTAWYLSGMLNSHMSEPIHAVRSEAARQKAASAASSGGFSGGGGGGGGGGSW